MMKFQVWICLDYEKDSEEEKQRVLELFLPEIEVLNWNIDNESIMTLDINLNDLEDLMILPALLDDDIVICGSESDFIMTKADMQELGLN